MSTPNLPDPRKTYFFRNTYAPEAIHTARKKVAEAYPEQPITTTVDGDFRGKDSFSLRCVDIEAALQEGTPAKDVLSILNKWSPIKRRDLHPDDITPTKSIQYDTEGDVHFLNQLLKGDQANSLSVKAAKRAKFQLEKAGPPQNGRVPLSEQFVQSLGPLEQVDISAPLTSNQKVKQPGVQATQNIWHYLKPSQQKQLAQNLQDTQAQGSYLIVGPTEAVDMDHLPGLLQRHGYTPDTAANLNIKRQRTKNPVIQFLYPERINSPVETFIYQKTEQ